MTRLRSVNFSVCFDLIGRCSRCCRGWLAIGCYDVVWTNNQSMSTFRTDTKSDERCGLPDTGGGGGHNDTETCHVAANGREIGFQNALNHNVWYV